MRRLTNQERADVLEQASSKDELEDYVRHHVPDVPEGTETELSKRKLAEWAANYISDEAVHEIIEDLEHQEFGNPQDTYGEFGGFG